MKLTCACRRWLAVLLMALLAGCVNTQGVATSLNPFSPNWEIEETALGKNEIRLRLNMKRYYSGGAGEARAAFERRARELMREGGFAAYEVVEYFETLDSSILGAQRNAEGVIRLKKEAG